MSNSCLVMKVFVIAAITADGYIGQSAEHFTDWTSKEDKKVFVRLTREAGAMVMGSTTFATIGRALPDRRNIVYTSKPEIITVEGVETTNEPPAELIERLKREGAKGLAVCGGASIYSLFMEAGVVDELYLTVEPVVFGGGISLFAKPLKKQLKLLDVEKLNSDVILLHYSVKKS